MPNRKIRLYILKKHVMTEKLRERYFRNGYFEVTEPFDFPAEVLKKLGIDQCRINPGIYPVNENDRFLTIDF